MDARMWHVQATLPRASLPVPVSVEVFEAWPDDEQDEYWGDVAMGLGGVTLPSVVTERAADRLTRLLTRNERRPPGAKAIGSVSARFATGKSTFVKDWAQQGYRALMGRTCQDPRPTWSPEPGVTADWVPQIYITLRAVSRIRELNAEILLFLGYPSEGLIRVTTTRVVFALKQHGVRLLIVDDAHMLEVNDRDSRAVLDYLKYLNTELGELGGTMILVGADLHDSPIYLDPQITSRLERISIHPYSLKSIDEKRDWQHFLKGAESALLPYFDCAPAGLFWKEHAGYIWRRTQGYVGDTTLLLTEALVRAFDDGSETITADHLDAVPLSARATAAEVDLRKPPDSGSSRRSAKRPPP